MQKQDWDNLLITQKSKQIIQELQDYRKGLGILGKTVNEINEELTEIKSIVEDFDDLCDTVKYNLEGNGFIIRKLENVNPRKLDDFIIRFELAANYAKMLREKEEKKCNGLNSLKENQKTIKQ